MVEDDEVLMHLRPQNTNEKLIWERHSNKELLETNRLLNKRNQQLEAELINLRQRMKQEQVGALILKNTALKNQIQEKDNKIKKYKLDNEVLLRRIIALQTTSV